LPINIQKTVPRLFSSSVPRFLKTEELTNGRTEERFSRLLGDHSVGVPPVPIPNTEVKPYSPDGTARASVWESRKLPGLKTKAPARKVPGAFLLAPLPYEIIEIQDSRILSAVLSACCKIAIIRQEIRFPVAQIEQLERVAVIRLMPCEIIIAVLR
jgi:hypothetical protein